LFDTEGEACVGERGEKLRKSFSREEKRPKNQKGNNEVPVLPNQKKTLSPAPERHLFMKKGGGNK